MGVISMKKVLMTHRIRVLLLRDRQTDRQAAPNTARLVTDRIIRTYVGLKYVNS